jgi:hypothetical protein
MPESAVERILNEVNHLSPDERASLLAALLRAGTEQPLTRRSALGKYSGLVTPVDEFLRLKREETARDDEGAHR